MNSAGTERCHVVLFLPPSDPSDEGGARGRGAGGSSDARRNVYVACDGWTGRKLLAGRPGRSVPLPTAGDAPASPAAATAHPDIRAFFTRGAREAPATAAAPWFVVRKVSVCRCA